MTSMSTSSPTSKPLRRRATPIADRLFALTAELRAGREIEVPLTFMALAYFNGCGDRAALRKLDQWCSAQRIAFQVDERNIGPATTVFIRFRAVGA
jgi:hypothetical protein